jgi:hypothetical protein
MTIFKAGFQGCSALMTRLIWSRFFFFAVSFFFLHRNKKKKVPKITN